MCRDVTAVSTLRDDLTFIVNVTLRKYDISYNSDFPIIISGILSFSKVLPENPRIHADSRNSKTIQGFVNTLDILKYSSGQYQQAILS